MRAVLAIALLTPFTAAQVRLGAPFQDHMVVQRDLPVHVFGTAEPGSVVAVSLGTRRAAATATAAGRFLAVLPPQPAGGPLRLVASGAGGAATCEDVLVGEVWLASGQSNMEWQMRRFADCADDTAASTDPGLRLLLVARATATEPATAIAGSWRAAGPEVVHDFSAVAYLFGRELRRRLGVPVGIVASSWGGTRAEAWTRRAALEDAPELRGLVEHWDSVIAEYPAARARYDDRLAAWRTASDAAKAAGERAPPRPAEPPGPRSRHCVGTLFEGMIAPLAPMTIRGVIWYQGEANVARAEQYRTLFPTLIRDWRAAFRQGDLPFAFVQLANLELGNRASPETWAELRDAQLHALRTVPATGMAVTIDIGDPRNIHPQHKDEVARRLALWARSAVYGERDLVPCGPLYESMRIEGASVRCRFEHAGGGLVAAGGDLRGFTIAGPDRRFVPARASIDGDSVVVWSPEVEAPVAVRYAWTDDPDATLRNVEDLPASPFRTDAWPGVTAGKRKP